MSPVSRKRVKGKSHQRRGDPGEPLVPRSISSSDDEAADFEADVADLGSALERVLGHSSLAARGLGRSREPVEAEIAASGLLALWSKFELPGQREPATLIGRAMIGYLEDEATSDALALILGLGAVEMDLLVECLLATRRMREAEVKPPPWGAVAGQAKLESAWLGTDVFGDQDVLVGRFTYLGTMPHDVSILVDHNILDIAKDIAVHRGDARLRSRWERQPDMQIRDISAQEYASRLADAFDSLDLTWQPPAAEDAYLL